MFEKMTLLIFLICLVSCASLILFSIWGNEKPPEVYFKIVATFFIVGLGSFSLWFVTVLYSLRDFLREFRSVR